MSYYEVLLFLHVMFAAIWIGAAVLLHLLAMRAKTAGDPRLMAGIAPHNEWLAKVLFIPASLAVLLLGILLTIEGPWGFDQLWIVLALVMFAVSFVNGLFLLEPLLKRLNEAIEAHGPESAEVAMLDRRATAHSWFDLAILAAIVWDMAVKPRGEDVGALIVLALILGAAVAYGVLAYRTEEGATQTAA